MGAVPGDGCHASRGGRNPDPAVTTYPSDPHYGLGRRVAVRSRLAVVYAESDWTVITVLWDGQTSRDDGPRGA